MGIRAVIAELKESISLLQQSFSDKFGSGFEGWGLKSLALYTRDMNVHQCQWKGITESGTDALGDFTIAMSGSAKPNVISPIGGYYRVAHPYVGGLGTFNVPHIVLKPHLDYTSNYCAIDFGPCEMVVDFYNNRIIFGTDVIQIPIQTKRLILPSSMRGMSGIIRSAENLYGGLYLPKWFDMHVSEWILQPSTVEIPVKNPPNSNVNYYLNRMGISADDMVGIFQNMVDWSTSTTTHRITLGSTNLAKLTEEQKNIAYAKGWDLA